MGKTLTMCSHFRIQAWSGEESHTFPQQVLSSELESKPREDHRRSRHEVGPWQCAERCHQRRLVRFVCGIGATGFPRAHRVSRGPQGSSGLQVSLGCRIWCGGGTGFSRAVGFPSTAGFPGATGFPGGHRFPWAIGFPRAAGFPRASSWCNQKQQWLAIDR